MEKNVYTFFHRTGGYDGNFAPLWQRFVCFGAAAAESLAVTAEYVSENELVLLLPERGVRLVDTAANTAVPVSILRPGDRFCHGDAPAPDCRTTWTVADIRRCGGSGDMRGWRITGR